MTYLPQIRILVPSAQVSSYTTGVLSLPSARGAFTPAVRALFAGGTDGSSSLNVIDYINIATTGNALDFGDLINTPTSWSPPGVYDMNGTSNSTRGVIVGGSDGSGTNIIQYVTIGSTGNAADFGDLTISVQASGATSSAHGGLS